MATYYVDIVNGNNANAGTSEGSGNAWQTIDKAATTAAAGDTVHIKATGDYTLSAAVTFTNNGNGTSGPIIYRGYTTTAGADDGRPNIVRNNSTASLFTVNNNSGLLFRHLKFTRTGASRGPGILASGVNSSLITCIDCHFDGCSIAIAADYITNWLIDGLTLDTCKVENCTSHGLHVAGAVFIHRTIIKNCTGDGIKINASYAAPRAFVHRCVIRDCDRGIHLGVAGLLQVERTAVYSNTNQGIIKDGSSLSLVGINKSIFHDNTYGVHVSAGKVMEIVNRQNAYGTHSTADRSGWSTGAGDVDISGDPWVAVGSDNFAPDNTSGEGALLRAASTTEWFGTDYSDIGPIQHQDAGGGGGILIHPGMSGGMRG